MSFLDSVISSIGTGGGSTYVPPPKVVSTEQPKPKPLSILAKRKAEDELKRTSQVRSPMTQTQTPQEPSVPAVPAAILAKKKNNFAAIMNRAKEAQAKNNINSIGSIKHKPQEKSKTFREITEERKRQKLAMRRGVSIKNGGSNTKVLPKLGVEKRPQTTASDYKGTTRPTEKPTTTDTKPKYTGTARPGGYAGTAQNGRNQTQARPRQSRNIYDDDDDSEGSYGRDDDGYYDDSDDDMDAGFDAVEDEEAEASRVARREDAAAEAELQRLAKEKAKKKSFLVKGKH